MISQMFVNLPVKDLKKTMAFFDRLGFGFDPRFTNEDAACMVIGKNIYCMLLRRERFKEYIPDTSICDATKQTEVMVALRCESRARVDEYLRQAVAAGGTTFRPDEDHGFMYARAFKDLDGHIWEVFWMKADQ
ncbi:VOC family protein [Fontimonas sp. SYSU GA230001]|uniref:VOC family protein n=1 Tax=Fontimonas sp. SYSU GA230001 TaxID=3142450 RepID=UPI0032B59D6D